MQWKLNCHKLVLSFTGLLLLGLCAGCSAARADDVASSSTDATRSDPVLIPQNAHTQPVPELTFSPDGQLIASAGDDQNIFLWSASTGDKLSEYSMPPTTNFAAVQFTPDGKQFVTSIGPDIFFWDRVTKKQVRQLPIPGGEEIVRRHLYFSNDGTRLVLWTPDTHQQVFVWNLATGKLRLTLDARTMAFNPNTNILAIANGALEVWDLADEKLLQHRDLPDIALDQLVFSPDNKMLASIGINYQVALFDANTWQVLTILQPACPKLAQRLQYDDLYGMSYFGMLIRVAFSPDSRQLACLDLQSTTLSIALWDIDTRKKIYTLEPQPWENPHGQYRFDKFASIAYCFGGRRIILWHPGSGEISVWNTTTGDICWKASHPDAGCGLYPTGTRSLAVSPDGRLLVAGGSNGTIACWDIAEGAIINSLGSQLSGTQKLVFTPDRTDLIVGTDAEVAHSWDLSLGCAQVMKGGIALRSIQDLTMSADGKLMARYQGNSLIIYDISTGKVVQQFNATGNLMTSLPFSPGIFSADSRRISAISAIYHEKWHFPCDVWDIASGHLLGHSDGDESESPLALSPDLLLLALRSIGTAGPLLRLRDLRTGQSIFEFPGNYQLAAISHNNRCLTALSSQTAAVTLTTWNTVTGEKCWDKMILVDKPGVYDIQYSPDDHYLTFCHEFQHSITLLESTTGKLLYSIHDTAIPMAFSHDGATFIARSDATVHVFTSATGALLAVLNGTGTIACATFSPGDDWLAIGSNDGSVRIWKSGSWQLCCTLMTYADGSWAVVDPQGRYDASNAGDIQGLRWAIGDESVALRQLKARYYEPNLLAKLLGYNDEPLREVTGIAQVKLFPTVHLTPPLPGKSQLHIALTDRGGGIGAVQVLVNGKEICADARGARFAPHATATTLTVDLAQSPAVLPGKENLVEVIAANRDGTLTSRDVALSWTAPGIPVTHMPACYAIIIGTSNYVGDTLRLRYAAHDATAFAQAIRLGAQRLFGAARTHLTLLTTDGIRPSKTAIRDAFARVAQQAYPEDVLLVYLAGHGVSLGRGQDTYCYLTCDTRSLLDLTDPARRRQVGVTSAELQQWCAHIAAMKQVLLLDTCAAGAAADSLLARRDISGDEIRAMERLKDRTGLHVLMGCAADAKSYEASRFGQGVLTYALLSGMKGAALREQQFVDVDTLFNYVADQVPILAAHLGGVQRPLELSPQGNSFDIGELSVTDRAQIPLRVEKPLVGRPVLLDPTTIDDPLQLSTRWQTCLRQQADANGPWDWVDSDDFPGATFPQGVYSMDGQRIILRLTLWHDGVSRQLSPLSGDSAHLAELLTAMDNMLAKALSH
jgi:WD40 repeat protein